MQADLLITALIDLDGGGDFSDCTPTVCQQMVQGKAGQLRHGTVPQGWFAARAEGAPGREPDAGAQDWAPVVDPDGGYTLFAGRIQDRAELAVQLGIDPALPAPAFYAALHARYGENCDGLIYGDYAAIRWFPQRGELRLSRSPTSFCPLHVWRHNGRLAVSSIPRALFAAGLVPKVDQAKLGDSLFFNYRDASRSWFTGASRVECGTMQWHDRAGMRRRRFWSVHSVPEIRLQDDADYVAAVDDAFRKGTQAELQGVTRPAISLSGGLDSQGVASYMAEIGGPGMPIISFTSVPQSGWQARPTDTSFGDEAAHVRALAQMYPQISPHFVTGEARHFGQDLDAMFALGSWPTRNETNMHWVHDIYARASEMGCDALFFGAAGNTGFSYDGLTGFPTWLAQGRWWHMWQQNARLPDHRPAWRRLVSRAVMPHLPLGLRRLIDAPRVWRPSPFATWCPLREGFARDSGVFERARQMHFDPDFYDVPTSRHWRAAVLDDMFSESAEIELALRLHHGIAVRDPTLYQPLLDLCIGIPDDQYLRDGTQRWLARRVLQGRVPEMVRTEPRAGRQAADWALRFQRDRSILLNDLAQMRDDPMLARVFDVERLSDNLAQWPGADGTNAGDYDRICAALGRAVSTARFMRYVQQHDGAG